MPDFVFVSDSPLEEAGFEPSVPLGEKWSFSRRSSPAGVEEPKFADSPVEEAVLSELVSEAKFPASRENELRVFAALADAEARLD